MGRHKKAVKKQKYLFDHDHTNNYFFMSIKKLIRKGIVTPKK